MKHDCNSFDRGWGLHAVRENEAREVDRRGRRDRVRRRAHRANMRRRAGYVRAEMELRSEEDRSQEHGEKRNFVAGTAHVFTKTELRE